MGREGNKATQTFSYMRSKLWSPRHNICTVKNSDCKLKLRRTDVEEGMRNPQEHARKGGKLLVSFPGERRFNDLASSPGHS